MNVLISVISIVSMFLLCSCQMSMSEEEQSKKLALSDQSLKSLSPSEKNEYIQTYRSNLGKRRFAQMTSSITQSPSLYITVSDGLASMPPLYSAASFKTASIELNGNGCDEINLHSQNDPKQYSTLSLCYLNDFLYIDASSRDRKYPIGSVIIPISSKVADSQKFCPLSTKGNSRLQGACITVKQRGTPGSPRPMQTVSQAPKNKKFRAKLRNNSDE